MTAGPAARIVQMADLAGTFVFAVEGALAAIGGGFDPVGVLALAFATALGGGVIRDLLIGATPVAAVQSWWYSAIVLAASGLTWALHPAIGAMPEGILTWLDAAGLALFAVAGTEKSLARGIAGLPAMFLGTISGVGGGTIRDVLLNQVPRVLHVDVYASAALAGAAVLVAGRALGLPARPVAVLGGLVCFAVRVMAAAWGWQLPRGI